MAALSSQRDINTAAVTSFGKTIWSPTKRRFSKSEENTMKENNRMESSKQRVYSRAGKRLYLKNKEITKDHD